MLTHRWHDFVVQVLDKLGGFLLDSFRGIADRFVDARGSVLDFAVEIVHKSFGPRAESCWTWQTSHYFLTGAEGQSPTCDNRLDCRRITIPSAMKRSARMEARDVAGLRRALLAWYEKSRRDLPWRKTRDPYRVWVSEIMLQQTRVAVVIPRYKKFLHRFQSVEKLASARVTSVLAEWSGLGYYRRARNLHAAAKIVARAGKFPKDAEGWRELPGIGRYTAAAIASIAFDEPVAGLDGNVERVLRRLAGQTQTSAQAWGAAQSLLDHDRPGDFNQAMMELGATICVPGEPLCAECPIRKFCRTRGRGKGTGPNAPQLKRQIAFVLATDDGCVRLVRRPKHVSLMPGMWELPSCEAIGNTDEVLFSVKHAITVTDFNVRVMRSKGVPSREGRWVKISRLNTLPLTGLATKILRKARIIL
jgi:A/G-specific adenine glycosylase